MSIKRVNPSEAAELVAAGWTFVDVRTIPEFEAGHPAGAYNVPFLHQTPSGRAPNQEFLKVMEARFSKHTELVLGCRTGVRSLQAAQQLVAAGWQHVVDMQGGYAGDRTCEGWQSRGLAVETTARAGRSYDELK